MVSFSCYLPHPIAEIWQLYKRKPLLRIFLAHFEYNEIASGRKFIFNTNFIIIDPP